MIIVGLHSIHGIDSNTPEGAGAHPKEGGLRPTQQVGGGVGQLNSMSLTPARSTPVQVLLNDSQVFDGTPPDGTEGGDQEDELVVYEVGIEVEPAEKFDLSDFVEDGNVINNSQWGRRQRDRLRSRENGEGLLQSIYVDFVDL